MEYGFKMKVFSISSPVKVKRIIFVKQRKMKIWVL